MINFSRYFILLLILLLSGCAAVPPKPVVCPLPLPMPAPPPVPVPPVVPPTPPPPPPLVGLVQVPPDQIPTLADDMDEASLERAIDRSLQFFKRVKNHRTFSFGDQNYTVQEMRESLLNFREIILSTKDPAERESKIRETFAFYRSTGRGNGSRVLFTGYFEPVLEGALKQQGCYQYPIYRRPDDMILIDLGKFKEKYKGEKIVGRISNREIVPYYNREEIDSDGALENRGLELVWLADPIDAFFLHIQGSGVVRLPSGRLIQIGYADANGRPYRSIGRYLIDNGKITPKESSHQRIKQYLREHPEEIDDILNHNESYVFFRIVDKGPIGSLGVTITGGRSIATDPKIFPEGALTFIKLRKPNFDDTGNLTTWTDFSRFTLNQDTGGVIRGPGRVDIFCGRGESAEQIAGSLKEEGDLYFIVKKKQNFP